MAGSTKDLNEANGEALRALMDSLTPAADGKMSPALAEKLSKKVSELIGTDAITSFAQDSSRGELLNEDGLPIIDITEPAPISGADSVGEPAVPLHAEEERLVPLTVLPMEEREQLRRERERILDMLEEEERTEARKERDALRAHTDEMLRARREAAAAEKVRLQAAREVQKKMGKALMRGLKEERQKEVQARKEILAVEEKKDKSREVQTTQTKKVAFADAPEEISREGEAQAYEVEDSGDVVLARLRSAQRPTLISNVQLDRNPMKMKVVERVPGSQPFIDLNQGDSDDESEPPASPVGDADDDSTWPSVARGTSPPPPESDEESTANSSLAEGEIDLDFAHHQREIALEYHKKRTLMHSASDIADTPEDGEHAFGEADMPTHDLPKPTVSRFKASRIASSYTDSSSASSSSHIVQPSTRTIQKAIRRGKLDADGQLVAGDNSDDEDHGELQEIMELLAKGEIYNLGPDGNLVVPPLTVSKLSVPATDPQPAAGPSALGHSMLPLPKKPKTSRFKLAHGQTGRNPPPQTPPSEDSRSSTPISNAPRSSPKSHSPPDRPLAGTSSPAFLLPQAPGASFPSMIVESPSFPQRSTTRAGAASPEVLASPSFPDPSASRRPTRPPAVLSSVRESHPPAPASAAAEQEEPMKRMSRFMSERP